MELVARAAAFLRDEDENFEALVMAEQPDGDGESLEIQRALAFDSQDRRLGQDTHCLVVTNGPTHYGGVQSWRITQQGALELWLSSTAAEALGIDRDITVRFAGEAPASEGLHAGLVRLLGDDLHWLNQCEELQARVRAIIVMTGELLDAQQVGVISEMSDANEPRIALETISDLLAEKQVSLPEDVLADIAGLAERLGLGAEVVERLRP